uniref:Retrovirus-related Pol polyprotein from transposon TNT 1-94-like beta-barrel domain-containing protein n=1 Tax=Cajanus cajan TaxID=3821 RepID=A0A151TGU2_CAJCA|nr:hypothetical protein KK1_012546 [Cajanus cajan]
MVTNTNNALSPTSWFPDSDASFHVIGNQQNIQQINPFKGLDQIFIGNGQGLPIHSSSSLFFLSQYNPKFSLALHNLLHVPNITKNLISVSKFAKGNSVFFEFHSTYCLVKYQATNEVLVYTWQSGS